MKKIFYCVVAAFVLAACVKEINEPINEEPIQEETEKFPEIKLPVDLPENIEDILINTPCWHIYGKEYSANVSGGNIVIFYQDKEFPIGGDANRTYKFNKDNELIYYYTYVYPNIENNTRYKKLTWNLDWILKYSDEEILYAATDPTVDGTLSILILRPGTQEHLNNLLSKLPDDN